MQHTIPIRQLCLVEFLFGNFLDPSKMNGMNRETRRLKNLVRSNVRFRPTTISNNGSANRLKEGMNVNYSQLPNTYFNNLANRVRRTQRRRYYNNAAARRTGEAFSRAARNNTNMAQEIKQEFVTDDYTPEEEEVFMNAVHHYGSRNRNGIRRHINRSLLSNNSKQRLRNMLAANRAVQGLVTPSNPRYTHPEWVPADSL